MKANKILLVLLITCSYCFSFGQEVINGIVKDATTQTPLPFATIQFSDGRGVITNENGRYNIPKSGKINFLKVSYVGYKSLTIPVSDGDLPSEILMQQIAVSIDEILVLAKDNFASSLLYKSINKSRKDAKVRQHSKTFRRTYSYRENQPSEHMEAFYSTKMRDGGVDFFHLKNGRYGVPSDTSFINMQMTNLLENYKLFTSEYSKLPASPLEYTSLKKIRKDFDVRVRNKYIVEQDTIYELSFEPLRKKDILFEGMVWIKKSNLIIEKVQLDIQNTARNPFIIVPDPDLNKAKRLDMSFTIGFRYHNKKSVFDYIHSTYKMLVSTPIEEFEVSSNTNFYFYDYGEPFLLPLFPEFIDRFHDYEKILCFPYDEVFWEKNFLIAETDAEKQFREELISKKLFKNQGGEQAELIRRRFEPWDEDWKIEPQLVSGRELWETKEVDEILYINRIGVPTEFTLFAKTFIYLDYACYPDTIIFNTEAILDYRFCFSIDRTTTDFKYMEYFLHLAKIHANNFESSLIKKYGQRSNCPSRSALETELDLANKSLDKAIKAFNDLLHYGTTKDYLKRLKNIRLELGKSFEQLKHLKSGME